jgi:hypothetical protein
MNDGLRCKLEYGVVQGLRIIKFAGMGSNRSDPHRPIQGMKPDNFRSVGKCRGKIRAERLFDTGDQ